jgi:hypothetical protein
MYGVINSLEFAKDLVKCWLEQYKFKTWTTTNTNKQQVTPELRKQRAHEVAEMLCDHITWRTHGRSLKIEDLIEDLFIERIDDDKDLADIVYRIKAVVRVLFESSTVYKIFFIDDLKISKTFTVNPGSNIPLIAPSERGNGQQKTIDGVELDITCPKCGKAHRVNGYMNIDNEQIKQQNLKTNPNIKDKDLLVCDNCNFTIDLKPITNQLELQTRKKITFK